MDSTAVEEGSGKEAKARSEADSFREVDSTEEAETTTSKPGKTPFDPQDRTQSPPSIHIPNETWTTVLESICTFPPDIFHTVMLNLVKNPNVTSSYLFRADIFYDSDSPSGKQDLEKHLKPEYRPRPAFIPGHELTRTIVRQLVPRNSQLDKTLLQTCHFFRRIQTLPGEGKPEEETNIVLYIPHVAGPSDIPFYHPPVSALAFSHSHPSGTLSISYNLFPNLPLTPKLQRTALRLLQTVHKHGQGQSAGYEKRVHLDRIIPQKRYQDTYARLKAAYGRRLSEGWVEVTDPGKHVFEDIGIAAFLIELWKEMYPEPETFPGFVDIGCGNGLLVYLLLSEGYKGWGFDARERKTWASFPEDIQKKLEQRLLVPDLLCSDGERKESWHNGLFAPKTFIISNHADELTIWTPLLAYLNDSSFIAIPCCSHDLAGSRFRAPPTTKAGKTKSSSATRLPQQNDGGTEPSNNAQAAETGSLKRTEAQKKMPSAYATLCSYVASLAEEVGFEAEKEVLRIPSTRNQSIIGRRLNRQVEGERREVVVGIVERELGKSISVVGAEWIARAEKLALKPGSGH